MDLVRALAADLRDLAVDLSAGGYTRTTLAMLDRNLRRSAVSTLGSTVTLVAAAPTGATISVNFVSRIIEPYEIASALEVALGPLVPGVSGSVVFYSSEPDAFEPLADELAEALGLGPREVDRHPTLPSMPVAPNVEGLEDFSLLNRALGVLMNRGYTVDEARAELGLRAQRSHTAVTAAARTLLASACY